MSVELRAGKVAYVPVKCRRSRLVALRAFGATMDRDRGVLWAKCSLVEFPSRLKAKRVLDGREGWRWGWCAEEIRTLSLAGLGHFKLRQLRGPASPAVAANDGGASPLCNTEVQYAIDCYLR